MKKLLSALLLWALCLPAIAADNAVTLTTGSGVTMRTTDVGAGVQSSNVILSSIIGTAIYGTAGTANTNVLTIQGIASGTTVPVTGTITAVTTVTNLAQMNGAALLMGNGVTGTGSQRVTIASDNTAFSVNVANTNANGSATSANSSPVVIASDQVAIAIKAASGVFASGSISSGALASGSVASGAYASGSIGSGAIASGALASGAYASGAVSSGAYASGSLASGAVVDITNMSVATGAAPPSKAIYLGANASGATGGLLAGLVQCDQSAVYDASTNGATELQALTSGRSVYVCGYSIIAGGTVTVKLVYGTGTACATGETAITPAWSLTTQVGIVDGSPFYRGAKKASANALCIKTSAGVAVQAVVYYAII